MSKFSKTSAAASFLVASSLLAGHSGSARADGNTDVLYADGPYATILGRVDHSDGPLDVGFGGSIGGGLRRGPVSLELNGTVTHSHSSNLFGGNLSGLVFPFEHKLPGLFGIVGVGASYVDKYPGIGSTTFNITTVDAGAGYLLPLHFGSYEAGLRGQVTYEYGKRQQRAQDQRPPNIDIDAQSNFHAVIASIGLQFPFGKVPPTFQERPVEVVAPVAEAPPPPPPPKPDCRKPAPGEAVTLDGCGAGDVIVLNGVNFDFNKATLTPNAETILDQVGGELSTHPDITIELAGHTDSRGSDAYNQKLSQARAESVRNYFVAHGIAGDRITAVGYGETQPIASNDTDEGRERNRRVELRITSGGGAATAPAEGDATPAASNAAAAADGTAAPDAAAAPAPTDAVPMPSAP